MGVAVVAIGVPLLLLGALIYTLIVVTPKVSEQRRRRVVAAREGSERYPTGAKQALGLITLVVAYLVVLIWRFSSEGRGVTSRTGAVGFGLVIALGVILVIRARLRDRRDR